MLCFTALWLIIVYSPLAHMVWDNGFISQLGAIDFAGGTVVHISCGVTALVLALIVGPRKNKAVTQPKDSYVFIGGLLMWLGWFGFNGGSALAANKQAVVAMVNTFLASAAALLAFSFLAYRKNSEVSVTNLFNGSLAGLVAITPAAGFVAPWAAIVIGLLAAPAIHWATTTLKVFFKYDEPLDAFGIHGVGGIVGAILTGIFASKHAGSAVGGLIDGHFNLLVSQIEAIVITVILTASLTFFIAKIAGVKGE
ncbi:hypothetical protein NFX39_00050 [Fructobacillus sp. W13]|uniref:Ammonium transporter n=1 Tax=Fructobacillus apis TaxID=2935017 RepID=A0ABT0ZNA4_9LACO|nr:hypothetical protein [Fructobacillus apis]MCO0831486.1 hypothetical protein [Fructobacillus apis]